MVATVVSAAIFEKVIGSSPEFDQPRWYAAVTNANHEKRVALQLGHRLVEHFLPLYDSMRCWKDRRMKLQLPLFPGYVFVRIALCERLRVLEIPGLARLVGFLGRPFPLPDSEIEALRTCLKHGIPVEPYRHLQVGCRIRVKAGPLEGLEGFVLRRQSRLRCVISLDLIRCSAAVEVKALDLEPVLKRNRVRRS